MKEYLYQLIYSEDGGGWYAEIWEGRSGVQAHTTDVVDLSHRTPALAAARLATDWIEDKGGVAREISTDQGRTAAT